MCEIVAYVGKRATAKQRVVESLQRLNDGAYDTAGMVFIQDGELHLMKREQRSFTVERALQEIEESTVGVGHTRWMTHGKPTIEHLHPQQSYCGRFAIVLNGTITNAKMLRDRYLSHVAFESSTDTEVLAHLIGFFVEETNDVYDSFLRAIRLIEGTYAVVCIHRESEHSMYVSKKGSPLYVGLGKESYLVTSALRALDYEHGQAIELEDGDCLRIENLHYSLTDVHGQAVDRSIRPVLFERRVEERGNYPHHLLKEISEQPRQLLRLIETHVDAVGEPDFGPLIRERFRHADRIVLVGEGSSYNAALAGKRQFEQMAVLPTEVYPTSEFVTFPPVMTDRTLVIVLAMDGATFETVEALERCEASGQTSLLVTNDQSVQLSAHATHTIFDESVRSLGMIRASSFTGAVALLAMIAQVAGRSRGVSYRFNVPKQFAILAKAIDSVLQQAVQLKRHAHRFVDLVTPTIRFVGSGLDYSVARESSRWFNELAHFSSTSHEQATFQEKSTTFMQRGENILLFLTNQRNARHVRALERKIQETEADYIVVAMQGVEQTQDEYVLPRVHPLLAPIIAMIPNQLVAYFAAILRTIPVDEPAFFATGLGTAPVMNEWNESMNE